MRTGPQGLPPVPVRKFRTETPISGPTFQIHLMLTGTISGIRGCRVRYPRAISGYTHVVSKSFPTSYPCLDIRISCFCGYWGRYITFRAALPCLPHWPLPRRANRSSLLVLAPPGVSVLHSCKGVHEFTGPNGKNHSLSCIMSLIMILSDSLFIGRPSACFGPIHYRYVMKALSSVR
jgi:hypothetical protein